MRTHFFFWLILFLRATVLAQPVVTLNIKADGYRGIWYSNQPSRDEFAYKYSGGLGTYPANHYPFSVYAEKVNKTFFCYGGTDEKGKTLLHMVSYFDHKTGKVPRPTVVLDKQTDNAHDNPVINIDEQGYIWIFSTAHGTNTPSFIHKSAKPYDIETFEQIFATKKVTGDSAPLNNFSYLQSWYVSGKGFLNLFTHYDRNVIPGQPRKPRRTTSYMTSRDGINYSEWKDIAAIGEGHYQTSGSFRDQKIGTAFNYHPVKERENGLNYRTNLYYMETDDFGETWQDAAGRKLTVPLTKIINPSLVYDYEAEGLNVYINDLTFDGNGNPVILFLTSKGFEPGPASGPRQWRTARFDGKSWIILPVTVSDHNYDMGSLYIDEKGKWLIVGPTAAGREPYGTGGEMVLWTSNDQGRSWLSKQLTSASSRNHSYARRPVSAHDDFFAFWADGSSLTKSVSQLYFCNKNGDVFRLPSKMGGRNQKPERVHR